MKIGSTAIMLAIVILITGCSPKGMDDYKEAVKTTIEIPSGINNNTLDIVLGFNTEGLDEGAIIDLSEYENWQLNMETRYDFNDDKNQLQSDIYFRQGIFGIDSKFFFKDDSAYIEIPFINKFMQLSDVVIDYNEEIEASQSIDNSIYFIDLEALMNEWLDVLTEEDVLSGSDEYVMTDEGQLKTTSYTINLSGDQMMVLYQFLKDNVDIEMMIIEGYRQNNFSDEDLSDEELEEIIFEVKELMDNILFTDLRGKANVDFDKRISLQELVITGVFLNSEPGQVESFEVTWTTTYSQLGKEIEFSIPYITDEDIVEPDDLERLFQDYNNL